MKKPATDFSQDNFSDDYELPERWQWEKLQNRVFFQEGPGLLKKQFRESGIPFLNIRTLKDERIDKSKCQYLDPSEVKTKYSHFLLDSGDIIVSSSGSLGKTAIISHKDLPLMLNTSVIRFRSLDQKKLLNSFLHLFLKSKIFMKQIEKYKTGSAQFNFGPSHLKLMAIPFPPLTDQQRIVARVEALLAHSNAARNQLSLVPLIMKKFRQAVLAAACSGRLTEGWTSEKYPPFSFDQIKEVHKQIAKRKFKEPNQLELENLPDLPENWLWINFSLLINKIKRGPSLKCNQEGNGVRYITSGNLDDGKLRLDLDQKYLDGFNGIEKCQLLPGDLILNCVNSLDRIGKSAIFDESHGIAIVGFNNYGLELNQNFILPKYANYFCQSEFFKRQLFFLVKHAVNQVSFATDELDPIAVSLPPLAEQHEIVHRLNTMFDRADAIEREVVAAMKRTEALTHAVLGKAFRGEL